MRTTLTLEPDVEQLLHREIRRTDRSMKAVVNDALRRGLGAHGKPPRLPRYRVQPHDFGARPGVDMDRFNQLVDELEAEEFARRRGSGGRR
ncbi:MAG: antitoxin [Alphaproteobacteria bacterium]|nr:antitoxin [Alphaproteobacteria bacterium]